MVRKQRTAVICIVFSIIWIAGAVGFLLSEGYWTLPPAKWPHEVYLWFGAGYRSLQMFGLNFDLSHDFRVHWLLQVARFSAPLFVFFAAIWTLSHPVRQACRLNWQRCRYRQERRIAIIGYGPVGQAVARRFAQASFAVTAIDRLTDGLRISQARTDHVLLLEGDGFSEEVMNAAGLHRVHRVFIALSDDMATLDAARAVRAFLKRMAASVQVTEPDIRVLLDDPEIAQEIADDSTTCTNIWHGIAAFALPQMAAEQLCRVARFDRTALDVGQAHAHLVLLGCGGQGEAIVTEFLLTAWRRGLGAPMISVLDRHSSAIASRFRRMAPALLLAPGAPRALPEESAPRVTFHAGDVESIDFSTDPFMTTVQGTPVTAYIFSCGDDTANLKAALALETAMTLRRVDAAPIFVRLWNGNSGKTADLGFGTIGMIHPFGSLEGIVEQGTAFDDIPDLPARRMHDAYLKAGKDMKREDPDFSFTEASWDTLDETYRVSSRRLNRHAEQKLEDLGFQWRRTGKGLPIFDSETMDLFTKVEAALDHGKMSSTGSPQLWTRSGKMVPGGVGGERLADRIRRSAIVEHDRWMTDRALDGWYAAGRSDASARDNQRRIHPSMTGWDNLGGFARRYDTIFLRALVTQGNADAMRRRPVAKMRNVSYLWLTVGGTEKKTKILEASAVTEASTELVIGFNDEPSGPPNGGSEDVARNAAESLRAFFGARTRATAGLCRFRIVFFEPPKTRALRIAEAIADVAGELGAEVSTSWSWNRAGGPTVAFAGHRDLGRLGKVEELRPKLKAAFVRAVLEKNCRDLAVGYAPGADRLAVACWRELGLPKPLLIFPFAVGEDGRAFATDDSKAESPPSFFDAAALKDVGHPMVARRDGRETPHQAQARELLDLATVLVALWDESGCEKPGSTGETVRRANERNIETSIV